LIQPPPADVTRPGSIGFRGPTADAVSLRRTTHRAV